METCPHNCENCKKIEADRKSEKKEVGLLPEHRGTNSIKRVMSVYRDLWKHDRGFDFKITNWGMTGKLVKSLLTCYTEIQLAALLIVFFNWNGVTGNDRREHETVARASFPINWFAKCVNQYEAYLRNTEGLDFDNELAVRKFIAEHLNSLSTGR